MSGVMDSLAALPQFWGVKLRVRSGPPSRKQSRNPENRPCAQTKLRLELAKRSGRSGILTKSHENPGMDSRKPSLQLPEPYRGLRRDLAEPPSVALPVTPSFAHISYSLDQSLKRPPFNEPSLLAL